MAAAPMARADGRVGRELPAASGMTRADSSDDAADDLRVQPVVRTNFADTAFWAAALDHRPPTAPPRSSSPCPRA